MKSLISVNVIDDFKSSDVAAPSHTLSLFLTPSLQKDQPISSYDWRHLRDPPLEAWSI